MLLLISPIGALTAAVDIMLFTVARLSWKVLAGITAVCVAVCAAIWAITG